MEYRFILRDVYFISDYAGSYAELKEISGDISRAERNVNIIKDSPVIKAVPMLLRRRLNAAGRMAIGLSIEACSRYSVDKVIYASRTGETLRCIKLLQEVYKGEGVAPTEFSASVHNSNIGVFSIINGFYQETTAVSAAENTLGAALTEACASLYGSDMQRVLVVCYEENLSNRIMPIPNADFCHGPFAGALVLERCRDDEISSNVFTFDYAGCGSMNTVDFFRSISFS